MGLIVEVPGLDQEAIPRSGNRLRAGCLVALSERTIPASKEPFRFASAMVSSGKAGAGEHVGGHALSDTQGQWLSSNGDVPDGVSISSAETFPTIAEAITAAAHKLLSMPERVIALDFPPAPLVDGD